MWGLHKSNIFLYMVCFNWESRKKKNVCKVLHFDRIKFTFSFLCLTFEPSEPSCKLFHLLIMCLLFSFYLTYLLERCFLWPSLTNRLCLFAALQFAPDITIVSAGFDAARGDPLGCCDVRAIYNFLLHFKIMLVKY